MCHLVRISDGDKWKTALKTPLGRCEYQVMPFGLGRAAAVFQAFINVLRNVLDKFVSMYLDDIMNFSQDPRDQSPNVRFILLVSVRTNCV